MGARDGAPGGLRGVIRGEDDAVRAGADPSEIMLRKQTTWENNVNLAQTEVRADGGPAAALFRLGRLRREHCRALRLHDEAWVRVTVHTVVFEASYAARTMRCAQVVGEQREPGAD